MSSKVVHFEIPAEDVKRAKGFYNRVFGWKTNDVPGMSYTILETAPTDENRMIKEPGAINGGMMKRGPPVTGPVITIDVEDIDSTAKDIEKSGGKMVVPKQDVGDMGYSAYFKDPEGNLMGLWQNKKKS